VSRRNNIENVLLERRKEKMNTNIQIEDAYPKSIGGWLLLYLIMLLGSAALYVWGTLGGFILFGDMIKNKQGMEYTNQLMRSIRMKGNIIISDDKSMLHIDTIKQFLSRSYWANKRPEERTETSIKNSICYGAYDDGKQVGFARVITDDATMYYLCDVFIDEDYRGMGIGKELVSTITNSERFRNLLGLLGTLDAHELYEQYGFLKEPDRFMRRTPDYMKETI
jgi:GNAT superfamily N-acetyltransferase